jgi:hypothetical protein
MKKKIKYIASNNNGKVEEGIIEYTVTEESKLEESFKNTDVTRINYYDIKTGYFLGIWRNKK